MATFGSCTPVGSRDGTLGSGGTTCTDGAVVVGALGDVDGVGDGWTVAERVGAAVLGADGLGDVLGDGVGAEHRDGVGEGVGRVFVAELDGAG